MNMKNPNDKKDENEHLYIKPPSFLQMAKNFTKAVADHVSNGMVAVSQDKYIERLDACNSCPNLLEEKKRCGLCGCFLEHKAKWERATCPDTPSRWDVKNGSDEEVDYPRTGGLSPDTGPRH
jgi:hypothetical protein